MASLAIESMEMEAKVRNATEAFEQIGLIATELQRKIPKTSVRIHKKLGSIMMISVAEVGLLRDEI